MVVGKKEQWGDARAVASVEERGRATQTRAESSADDDGSSREQRRRERQREKERVHLRENDVYGCQQEKTQNNRLRDS